MLAQNKFENPFENQEQKAHQERLGGYFEFNLNNSLISYVNVQNKRLYFQKYNQNATISDLSTQYSELSKGKQLKLFTDSFAIDPKTPLSEITSTPEKIEVLEKVLKNVAQEKDPIQELQKFGQKKIVGDLVYFMKKHNQKIQNKNKFQSHQCLIQLKERPQCGKTLNYFVTETTTINEIAEKINLEARNYIPIMLVEAVNQITYSREQFSKPFSLLARTNFI